MLFYSYQFILLFLPIVFVGFFWLARRSRSLAVTWLAGASLLFYGYWNPRFLLLLMASVTFNYVMASGLVRSRDRRVTKVIFVAAVAVNLAVLGYFKYTNFFISTAQTVLHVQWRLTDIALPLGISIFTFTQIAFIVDVYRGITREYNYLHYLLFVTYFPHLIAGPIIHHRQFMPQFENPAAYRVRAENVAIGLGVFTVGLAKKILLAASFAGYSDPLFDAVKNGVHPVFLVAWTGTLAYTLQVYFDFSGYSDMAIGLARMFGVILPENFDSPYKAGSIVEFWRRWNMTLSRFLRDYLYIPLGGNRRGRGRSYVNLLVTMLLGGLWHGASWTFVAWGALHGMYLVLNHAWKAWRSRFFSRVGGVSAVSRILAVGITFLAVVVAWVFFRADSFLSAYRIIQGMMPCCGVEHWAHVGLSWNGESTFEYWMPPGGIASEIGLLAIGLALVWIAPNTRTLVSKIRFIQPGPGFLMIGALLFWIVLLAAIGAARDTPGFIYFNF